MTKKPGFFIKGIPISPRWKLLIITFFLIALVLNSILPRFFEQLDYTFNGGVSILLIALIVLFSIGSKITEGLIIGLALFALLSNIWDFFVRDFSSLRNQILIGSMVVLTISLIFGKISVINLIHILRKQLGVEKK